MAAQGRGHAVGLAVLRGVVGGLFVGHGAQKALGAFDGPGPDGAGAVFEQVGLKPGRELATVAGLTEMVGGGLVALGAAVPLATSMLTGVMTTAIRRVHLAKGPWATNGGYEYPLVLGAVLFAVADVGPGTLSVDHLLGRQRRGGAWALGQLAVGVGAAVALDAVIERLAARGDGSGDPSFNGRASSGATEVGQPSEVGEVG